MNPNNPIVFHQFDVLKTTEKNTLGRMKKKTIFASLLKLKIMLENFSFQELKRRFDSNKNFRLGTYIAGGVIVFVLGILVYRQFMWKPANEKSKDAWWIGLNYAQKDSTDQAIEALRGQVKKFDGKVGGEDAQFILARQYMAKGEFKKALTELEGVDLNDTYVSVMTVGLQADCHSELKQYEEAAELYTEAAEMEENDLTTPMYLFKAGLCFEKLKNFEKATECYQKIKDDYSAFAGQKSIEKYIARSSNKTKK
jgi:tetratricopeptide (TPR) repeat protein